MVGAQFRASDDLVYRYPRNQGFRNKLSLEFFRLAPLAIPPVQNLIARNGLKL